MPQSRHSAASASGSFARATVSALLPMRGQRFAMAARRLGRSSNPVPQTTPIGSLPSESAASADSTSSACMPAIQPEVSRRWARASASVSWSPKKSATSGVNPPRRADAARARPEAATIRTVLSIDLAGELERVAEIETHRLFGADHFLEQAELGLVLHVADGQRADAERAVRVELGAVGRHLQTFDAGGRNCIDVGDHQQIFGCSKLRRREDADTGAPGTQGRLDAAENVGLLTVVTAVGCLHLDIEARLDFTRGIAHALDAIVADQCHGGLLQRRNHGGREADHS